MGAVSFPATMGVDRPGHAGEDESCAGAKGSPGSQHRRAGIALGAAQQQHAAIVALVGVLPSRRAGLAHERGGGADADGYRIMAGSFSARNGRPFMPPLRVQFEALCGRWIDYTPSNSFLQGIGKCARIKGDTKKAMTELPNIRKRLQRGRGCCNRLPWIQGLPREPPPERVSLGCAGCLRYGLECAKRRMAGGTAEDESFVPRGRGASFFCAR